MITRTMSISGTSFTIEHVQAFLDAMEDAPTGTVIKVSHSPGDRPWDSTHYTLSATYEPLPSCLDD